jgi:hypothetical protein
MTSCVFVSDLCAWFLSVCVMAAPIVMVWKGTTSRTTHSSSSTIHRLLGSRCLCFQKSYEVSSTNNQISLFKMFKNVYKVHVLHC